MDKTDPPASMGVFKPVGHVVISFPTADQAQGAASGLASLTIPATDITRYTPEQMVLQVDRDIANASPLASIGQELNLVKAHRALAERGYHFLVVRASDDDLARQVAAVAKHNGAERAQQYGRFVIEELIEQIDDERQTFESPARGLDAQTPSGREKERSER